MARRSGRAANQAGLDPRWSVASDRRWGPEKGWEAKGEIEADGGLWAHIAAVRVADRGGGRPGGRVGHHPPSEAEKMIGGR